MLCCWGTLRFVGRCREPMTAIKRDSFGSFHYLPLSLASAWRRSIKAFREQIPPIKRGQSSHAALSESITPFRDAFLAPGVPRIWDWSTEIGRVALDAEVSRQALMIGYLNDFRFMMYLSLLAVPLLLLLRSPRAAGAR